MDNLKATKRDKSTSGFTNKLRADGFIPAILYGGKLANEKISIAKRDVKNFIQNESFLSTVFEIELNETDKEKAKGIIKEISEKLLSNTVIEDYKINLEK